MKRLFWHWVISAIALWLAVAVLHQGVQVEPWYAVLWLGPLLGLLNAVVGLISAIIKLLAFPVNLLTLGCFGFVLSLVLNGTAVYLLSTNMKVLKLGDGNWWHGVGWGIALVVVMAVFSMLLNVVLPSKGRKT